MLGYSDSAKELGPASATLRLFGAQQRLARWAASERHPAGAVPRPRRGAGPRRRARRAGGAGAGPGLGSRPVQGHRAGRGDLREIRPPRDRAAAPGAGGLGRAAGLGRSGPGRRRRRGLATADPGTAGPRHGTGRPLGRPAAELPGRSGRSRTGSTPGRCGLTGRWSRPKGSPSGSPGSAPWRRSARCGSGRGPAAGPRPVTPARRARRPARDPVGLRVGPDAGEPARLVRPGQRPGRRRRQARTTGSGGRAARDAYRPGRCSPCCWTTPR